MISVTGVTSLGRVQGLNGHPVTKWPYKPIMTHCFNNNITCAYLKGNILAKSQQMLQLFPHSREIQSRVSVSVFCESIFKEQKKKAEKEGEALIKSGRQTARGTPRVFAQLALMDKSITQSFHATSYYPHVRCLEKNLLSQVQEMKVFIKKKIEIA